MAQQAEVGVINSSIEAAKKGLELYNKVFDEVIPWKTFEDTINELGRYKADYSEKSGKLVGEVTTSLRDALAHYFTSMQSIYEWCDLTRRFLGDYIKLYDNYKPENAKSQKQLILMMLEKGITLMGAAQELLSKSVLSFNDAAGKLVELKNNLTIDFDSKSDYYQTQLKKLREQAYGGAAAGLILGPLGLIISYIIAAGITEGKLVKDLEAKFEATKNFYNQLLEKVKGASVDIDKTTPKLEEEKELIVKMKNQTEETKFSITYDDLEYYREKTVPVAKELIQQCEDYLKRHGKKNVTK